MSKQLEKLEALHATLVEKREQARFSGGLVAIVMAIAFAALAFVVSGLVLSYGALVNANVGTGLTGTSAAINGNVTSGLNTFGSNMPTVAQVIVAVLIISLLFYGFGSLISKGQGGGV